MSDKTKALSTHVTFAVLFALGGLILHPLFFLGMFYCLISAQSTRKSKIAMAAVSLVCVLAAFGYIVGKDLAVRDNARDSIR